jgi:hypothetical protein
MIQTHPGMNGLIAGNVHGPSNAAQRSNGHG